MDQSDDPTPMIKPYPSFGPDDHSDCRYGLLHEHFVQGIYTLNQGVTPIEKKIIS